jgi:RNA polymerase sigma-70 factor (ECF subfamily)
MPLDADLYDRDVKDNTETTLVRAALNGDADSFGRLCEQYYSAMVAIAYSRLHDRDLAEDTVQEAFFVAFRDLSKLKETNQFGRWLARICRNVAIDTAKARAKGKLMPIDDFDCPSNDSDGEDNNVALARNIVSSLPARLREVVYLRFYNHMSYQQISDVLGISKETVNGRLRRAKKTIAKELNRLTSIEVRL